jgi:hypothetical protein
MSRKIRRILQLILRPFCLPSSVDRFLPPSAIASRVDVDERPAVRSGTVDAETAYIGR